MPNLDPTLDFTFEELQAMQPTLPLFNGLEGKISIFQRNSHQRTIEILFSVSDATLNSRKQILYEEGNSNRGLIAYVFAGQLYVGGWNKDTNPTWETFLKRAIVSNTSYHLTLILHVASGVSTIQTNSFRGYLDGVVFGSGTGARISWNRDGICLGGTRGDIRFHDGKIASGTGSHVLKGKIDRFRVYNKALTATEIFELAGSVISPSPTPTPVPTPIPTPTPTPTPTQNRMGTNMSSLVDWGTNLPFLNLFKTSRPWIVQTPTVWDTGEYSKLSLDANNYPLSLPTGKHVGTLMCREIGKNYPGGKYVVLYEGEGTVEYGFAAQKIVAESKPGRDIIDVTPDDAGIYLKITATKAGNHIRNIRVLPILYENSTEIFNPEFIDRINPFTTLRFMDWQETNFSKQSAWSNRPTPTMATYQGIGAPAEVMVALANQTQSHMWICLPHLATDDYVMQFADYIKNNLNSGLKVYVEYSNEIWNTIFSQGTWIEQQGVAAFQNNESGYTKRLDWFSKRTVEVIGIFETVFGADKERIVGVMAVQSGHIWLTERCLQYKWTATPKTHKEYGVDAIAIAPYFGHYLGDPGNQPKVQAWTTESDGGLNKLFTELTTGIIKSGGALKESYVGMQYSLDIAKKNGLELLAYEGGQHLSGFNGVQENAAITSLFIKANKDPRMNGIYTQYLNKWYELGGSLFVNFSDIGIPGKWGSWGVLEAVSQKSSPKYDAVVAIAKSFQGA